MYVIRFSSLHNMTGWPTTQAEPQPYIALCIPVIRVMCCIIGPIFKSAPYKGCTVAHLHYKCSDTATYVELHINLAAHFKEETQAYWVLMHALHGELGNPAERLRMMCVACMDVA